MAANVEDRKHIVLLPFSTSGRIVPFMVLAKKLASQGHQVSFIYFPPQRRPQVEDAYATRAGNHPLIRLVPLETPSDPEVASSNRLHDTVSVIPPLYHLVQDASFGAALDNLLDQLNPSCIISCEMLYSLHTPSNENIPRCVFFVMPATFLALLFNIAEEIGKGPLGPESINLKIPHLGEYPPAPQGAHDLVSIIATGQDHFYKSCAPKLVHEASAILVNSFPGAEPGAFKALNSPELNPNQVLVVAIGPLLPDGIFSPASRQELPQELQSFLDKQLPQSVVYISFGSLGIPSSEQLHEIAKGLEASQKPFLWIINSTNEHHELLPEGFLEKTGHFGMVTSSWVPQLGVLSHPAVGAYLTHCGWNSSMEAITMGIPVLTKPCMLDQYTNAWTLVHQLGMGVELSKDGVTLECNRVDEGIRLILGDSEQATSIRNRAKVAKAAAFEAWSSSGRNLEDILGKIFTSK